jgi:hypothetical protein
MSFLRIASASLAAWLVASTAYSLEPRTWIVLDGRIIEGELQKVSGSLVSILDTTGKQVQLDKSWISIGDNEYIKENFPDAKAAGVGFSSGTAVQLPQPAKTAKLDTKAFKLNAGTFSLPTDSYDIMETPHFKVMYQKPVDPRDTGELAERLWLDAAFFHATFTQKFRNAKMAIFLAPSDSHYDRIGRWYADLYGSAGRQEIAVKIGATWPLSAAGSMQLTNDIARKYDVVEHARVFRAYRKGSSPGQKSEAIHGVWQPFFVHCLASDMLDIQAGGVSGFGAKGWYAVDTGHSYYKEISLTGKSETSLLRARSVTAQDVGSIGGFQDAKNWASELKKLVRKGTVKPTLENIYLLTLDGSDAKGNVLGYAWSRYLQSSLPKLAAFNKLIQRVSSSHQMPEPEDLAKIYGFDSGAAMEADFMKYLTSADFR